MARRGGEWFQKVHVIKVLTLIFKHSNKWIMSYSVTHTWALQRWASYDWVLYICLYLYLCVIRWDLVNCYSLLMCVCVLVHCSYKMWERAKNQLTWTLHPRPCSQLVRRRVLSFVMHRGLSLSSTMLMTFLTLVHLVRQCRCHVLSGQLEKISISSETVFWGQKTECLRWSMWFWQEVISFSITRVSVIWFCW